MPEQKVRYFLIDGIRGLAIVNMVIFHFLYDVFMVFEKDPTWYEMTAVHLWQQAICCTFIFIAGFVWSWGIENNIRRGILFNVYGIVISLVTLIFVPSETIWFGILNFMGCAVLIMLPLSKLLKHIPPVPGLTACFLLFILCRHIQYGYVGIENLFKIQLPTVLYSIKLLTPFGFPFQGFKSGDFFPIFPWIFLYMCGFFGNKIFMRHNLFKKIACRNIPILSEIGNKSIWIYLIHQPISMLICVLLFN